MDVRVFKEIGRKIGGRHEKHASFQQGASNRYVLPSPFTLNKREGCVTHIQYAMHTWNIAWREPISKFSERTREIGGWRASARHVRSRHPVAYPRICLGPLFSTAHLLNLFLNHGPSLQQRSCEFFRSYFFHFSFLSLSLSRSYFKGAFVSLFPFCFSFFFFFVYIYFFFFCSSLPCFWQGAPCYSCAPRVLFLYSYESRASFDAEYCSGLKEEKKWDGYLDGWIMWRG